jgi:hypothetical protein
VETVASRLQETAQHIVKQGDAFVARTRDASVAFLGETRDAGGVLAGVVRTEARRWRRLATQRATLVQGRLQNGFRTALSLPAVERAVLTQVDGTLRALDARVRARLAKLQLEGKKAPAKLPKKATGAKSSRSRKSKPALPPIAA